MPTQPTGVMGLRAGDEDTFSGYTSVKDDPEFISRVKARIGKPFEHMVDPSIAANLYDPKEAFTILGVNTRLADTEEKRKKVAKDLGLGALPEGKHVFGVGAGARPQTWAHEFRHDFEHDEGGNSLLDLIYGSTSRSAYVGNVNRLWNKANGDEKAPFEEREKFALKYADSLMYNDALHNNSKSLVEGVGYPDIWAHKGINSKGPSTISETLSHPIDAATKGLAKTEMGGISQRHAQERAAYPFLLFAGRPDLNPTPKQGGTPDKYKRGGSIENTTHTRKTI